MITSPTIQESLTASRMSLPFRMKIVGPSWTGYNIYIPENLPSQADFVDLHETLSTVFDHNLPNTLNMSPYLHISLITTLTILAPTSAYEKSHYPLQFSLCSTIPFDHLIPPIKCFLRLHVTLHDIYNLTSH